MHNTVVVFCTIAMWVIEYVNVLRFITSNTTRILNQVQKLHGGSVGQQT